MPANLTPEYERAEAGYRAAATDEDRLTALREMFRTIPKHKGTEKLQADLKRRISLFRKTIAKKPSKGPDPFYVPRGGAGQVVLIGPPNAGKSSLVGKLTHAPVKIAEYPFTTALPVPGMCPYEDVQIELVDTPPVTPEHLPGGLIGTIRNSDIIAIIVDASADALEQAEMTLQLLQGRGLTLRSVPHAELDAADHNQHSAVIVENKSDLASADDVGTLKELLADRIQVLSTSVTTGDGLPIFVQRMWELLSQIRVYTKEPSKPPDMHKPFTLPIGSTVEDLAREIHRELPEKMHFARLWGAARFAGQQVHRTEPLHDRDVVEIHQ